MELLLLLYSLLFFFLAWRRLDFAVLILIATLPSYLIRFKFFGIPTTLLEIMIWLVFLAWLFFHTDFLKYIKGEQGIKKFFQNKKERIKYPFGWEISLLLIISFVSVAVAGFTGSALGIWKAYFFEPVLLFIVILNVFQGAEKTTAKTGSHQRTGKQIKKIFWAFTISALGVSLLAIFQKITGLLIFNDFWASEESRRVVSFFGYPNAIGLYLGPLVLLFIGWLTNVILEPKAIESGGENTHGIISFHSLRSLHSRVTAGKIFFISLIIVLSVLAIYFARSEGALIGVMVGLIIFGWLAGRKSRWVTVILVLFFGLGVMIYQPARNLATHKISLQDLSGQIRLQQWRETREMFSNGKIIFGSGLSGYQEQVVPYHQEGIFFNRDNDPDFHRKTVFNAEYRKKYWQPVETYLYPHNIILNFWVELGLAGVLLFIWVIGKYFVIGLRLVKKENNFLVLGLVGAMVVIVVHGLVDVPYFKNDLAIMFWILIAMMSLINLELKK